MEAKPNPIRTTAITLFIFLIYVNSIGCGKADFSGTESAAAETASTATPSAPVPAAGSKQKTWHDFGTVGPIGIYKGSAAKYGINYAPVIGAPCDRAEPATIDIRTCADNGVLCTTDGTPSELYYCCTLLHHYTCE